MKNLYSATVYSFSLRALSLFLQFASVLLLGRALGPEGLGVYAFYYALVSLVSIPLTAGMPTLSVREIARGLAAKQFGIIRGFIRRSTQLIALFSLILFAATAWWWGGGDFADSRIKLFSIFLVPLIALGNLRGAIMRGLGHVVSGQFPEYAVRPGVFVLLLLVLMQAMPDSMNPANAMLVHLLAAFIASVIGLVLLFRVVPEQVRTAIPQYTTREWSRAIVPFSIISGIQVVNAQTAVSVLGFLGQDADAGIFRLAQQISMVAAFPTTAVALVCSPLFATAYSKGDTKTLQNVAQMSTAGIFLFALFFFAGVAVAGKSLIGGLFGVEFHEAYPALLILLVGQLFNCATGALFQLLKMTGNERVFAWVAFCGAALNVALVVALVRPYGALGASAATACAMAFVNVALCVYAFKVLKVNPLPTKRGIDALFHALASKNKSFGVKL